MAQRNEVDIVAQVKSLLEAHPAISSVRLIGSREQGTDVDLSDWAAGDRAGEPLRLEAGETVSRPWLGIGGTTITSEIAHALELAVNEGAYVLEVVAASPADEAGLIGGGTTAGGDPDEGGDVITAADGQTLASIEDLIDFLNTKAAGDEVTLTVVRDEQTLELSVTLAPFEGS